MYKPTNSCVATELCMAAKVSKVGGQIRCCNLLNICPCHDGKPVHHGKQSCSNLQTGIEIIEWLRIGC